MQTSHRSGHALVLPATQYRAPPPGQGIDAIPSSTRPLQSSSIPLQTSGDGVQRGSPVPLGGGLSGAGGSAPASKSSSSRPSASSPVRPQAGRNTVEHSRLHPHSSARRRNESLGWHTLGTVRLYRGLRRLNLRAAFF